MARMFGTKIPKANYNAKIGRIEVMRRSDLIRRMGERATLCRRLALLTTDPHTAEALTQMANEGEADIVLLQSSTLFMPAAGEIMQAKYASSSNEAPLKRCLKSR